MISGLHFRDDTEDTQSVFIVQHIFFSLFLAKLLFSVQFSLSTKTLSLFESQLQFVFKVQEKNYLE